MDDIVAIRVSLADGSSHYFLTWGRLFDPVDPAPLESIVAAQLHQFSLSSETVAIAVCDSLQEASSAPYFFEALFSLSQTRIPSGDGYEEWRKRMAEEVRRGRELHYLGKKPTRTADG